MTFDNTALILFDVILIIVLIYLVRYFLKEIEKSNESFAKIFYEIKQIRLFPILKGEKGERGEQGIQGNKGEQGIQGIKGEHGNKN